MPALGAGEKGLSPFFLSLGTLRSGKSSIFGLQDQCFYKLLEYLAVEYFVF